MLQNRNRLLTIFLLISIYFTTIVYSAFDTRLQIEGDAVVRTNQSIRITNLELTNTVNGAYEEYNSNYGKDTTSMYLILPAASSITYTVEITNKVSDSYLIDSIEEISNTNNNIDIDLSLNINDIVNGNSTKTFTITITNETLSEQHETLVIEYGFKLNSFTVSFDANNALSINHTTQIIVSYNSYMPNITIPTKDGYIFKGYYSSLNAIDLIYNIKKYAYKNTTRINLDDSNNNWKWTTSGDEKTHIDGKIISSMFPNSIDFNDRELTEYMYEIEKNSDDEYIIYLNFDITREMVTNTSATNYETDYRFIDLEFPSSENEVSVDYITKNGKKYYNSNGLNLTKYDLLENTTLYAIWEPTYISTYVTELYNNGSEQLLYDNTTDNNLRYVGNNPNNYVSFNGELWRIIGVMNNISDGNEIKTRIKLMRKDSIGLYAWNEVNDNTWQTSTLAYYLNNNYYNSLSDNTQQLIDSSIWNISKLNFSNNTYTYYTNERLNSDVSSNIWNGKIGMYYPSDFGFATGGSHSTPNVSINVYPTVYLKSDILYDGGDGSENNPYLIKHNQTLQN